MNGHPTATRWSPNAKPEELNEGGLGNCIVHNMQYTLMK